MVMKLQLDKQYSLMKNSLLKVKVGILMYSEKSDYLVTDSGYHLDREYVIRELVALQMYLGNKLGEKLNPNTVQSGIQVLLENPQHGQCLVAWCEKNRIMGQLEIKKPFEVWHNASYWYLDNYVVLPEFQKRGVGTEMLNYVKRIAHTEHPEYISLYVGTQNIEAKEFYSNRGFISRGDLMKCKLS